MYGLTVYTHEKPKRFPSRRFGRDRPTVSTMDALNHRVLFLVEGLDLYIGTGRDGVPIAGRPRRVDTRKRVPGEDDASGDGDDATRPKTRARRARVFFFVFVVVVVERASIRDATRANAPR